MNDGLTPISEIERPFRAMKEDSVICRDALYGRLKETTSSYGHPSIGGELFRLTIWLFNHRINGKFSATADE